MRKSLAALAAIAAIGLAGAAHAKTIGVALASDTNPFYIAMLKGIETRAKALGYKVSVVTAEEDVARQLNGINDLIANAVRRKISLKGAGFSGIRLPNH